MGARTIAVPLIVTGVHAAPGVVIETFTGFRMQPNVQPLLLQVTYCGAIGDVAQVWLRPLLGAGDRQTILLIDVVAGTTPANEVRGCYSIPLEASLVPWVLGYTRSAAPVAAPAGDACITWSYAMSDSGAR